MLISPGCIPCILKQPLTLCHLLGVTDPAVLNDIEYETMAMLIEQREIPSAPHFSPYIQSILSTHLSGNSSLQRIKETNRKKAEQFIPQLALLMKEAHDPFEMAVRIAITGNTIDLGANPDYDLAKDINSIGTLAIRSEVLQRFADDVRNARRILYIADNYEEAVFDTFLLRSLHPQELVYAVRSAEILNDITLEDAKRLEMETICSVIESGSTISGTALEQATDEFLEYYHTADVVIAKGQGNFETLLQEKRSIYFMLKVKCGAISERTGHPIGTGLLYFHGS